MLEVEDIHTYYGDSHVLKNVSLTVDEGEIVGLLGRNGVGKTTTLRSITGIRPPRRGSIRFAGEEITDSEKTDIARAGIKLVLEDRRAFTGLTVDENLRLAMDQTHGDAWTRDRIYQEFPQLEERRNQRAGHLSGGEQQMLVMAQALLGNPKLILLDEPMEGLAPQIVEQIVDIVRRINADGISVLLVEQNLEVSLDLIDCGYILDKGTVELTGTRDELVNQRETVEDLLSVSA